MKIWLSTSKTPYPYRSRKHIMEHEFDVDDAETHDVLEIMDENHITQRLRDGWYDDDENFNKE